MADIRSVLGKFNGTMGGITFTQWKGKNVAKQKVPDTNTSATESQVRQRTSFGMLARLGGQVSRAIMYGFKAFAGRMTEQNAFNSRNKGAIKLDANDNPYIDFTEVVTAVGQLPGVKDVVGKYDPATGKFTVTHADNSNTAGALGSDSICLAVVQTDTNTGLVNGTLIGARNQVAPNVFQFAPGLDPNNIAMYTFALRMQSGEVSNSTYTLATHV